MNRGFGPPKLKYSKSLCLYLNPHPAATTVGEVCRTLNFEMNQSKKTYASRQAGQQYAFALKIESLQPICLIYKSIAISNLQFNLSDEHLTRD
jgi:hypothetical protein